MLHFVISHANATVEFDSPHQTLEFGRGPQREVPRQIIEDPFVSRDHLSVETLGEGRLRLRNLSEHNPVVICGADGLACHAERVVELPVQLQIGETEIVISISIEGTREVQNSNDSVAVKSLYELGESPNPRTLANWFETLICVQQAAAGSQEFYNETARAVVQLVGLDRGLVLMHEGEGWRVESYYSTDSSAEAEYSYSVLQEVLTRGRTFYQTPDTYSIRASLANIEAVVAAPIFNRDRQVIGAVYGSRTRSADIRSFQISELEIQVVQVLAAAVSAGFERERHRADAARSQTQFEQFFSPRLAQELAKDSHLLEGRQRELTILFSDVRNFSRISEQLGPSRTFLMMQNVMDLQTSCVREHDGVVVDYVGDGLLAMWNAPTDQVDHPARACRAVLAIMRQFSEIDEKWGGIIGMPVRLGMGMNTGIALVGNTGSRVKFKYGPMGPAVNLASRVEEATKHLGVPILLTESTCRHLDDSFATRRVCQASLPGIASPVHLHELSVLEPNQVWDHHRTAYETALAHFEARQWAEACAACQSLVSDAAGNYDVASLQLMLRSVECLKTNPDPFDPILHLRG